MDIRISIKKIEDETKKANIENSIFHYSNIYKQNNQMIEILSDKEISGVEVNSLGKIYFSKNQNKVFKNGVIDLIFDKYIIVNLG
ncbi:MAG: hypothetical protein LBL91_06450 [Lachnospiraceae bacterium]|jgi:hypothetical protein|nr:hypothetical protein [Lachnospiraceae bacterium]